jgi:hypothetical protein
MRGRKFVRTRVACALHEECSRRRRHSGKRGGKHERLVCIAHILFAIFTHIMIVFWIYLSSSSKIIRKRK